MSQTETQSRYRIVKDCHNGSFKVQVEIGVEWYTKAYLNTEVEAHQWLEEAMRGDTVVWEQSAEAAS